MLTRLTTQERENIREVFINLSKQLGNQNKLAIALNISRQTISLIIKGKNLPGAHIFTIN